MVYVLCAAAACARIVVACFQWMGRLYVLTNHRMILLRGVTKSEIFSCPLRRVTQTVLSVTFGERVTRTGSLLFDIPGGDPALTTWIHIARPFEVREIANQAIRRAL
jgi:hypothetical protein